MYSFLLALHSIFRWLVLFGMLYAIFKAYTGFTKKSAFTKTDNAVRHWTATLAHTQLIIGVILYIKSPIIQYFWQNTSEGSKNSEVLFFSLIHFTLMILAVVVITIGSAKAKRKTTDTDKHKTVLVWFVITLIIILIAIPWPFSPLASRPYFRPF